MLAWHYLIHGIVIGLAIAAPVGPIGVLCIRRTITNGRVAGFISGLGAASADAVYGCIAAFGLTIVSSFLIEQQLWLHLIGSTFLLFLSFRIFVSQPSTKPALADGKGLLSNFLSTFFLTITNPMTIISFVAIFTGLGLIDTSQSYLNAIHLVLGVFIGSVLWWFILSTASNLLFKRLGIKKLERTSQF